MRPHLPNPYNYPSLPKPVVMPTSKSMNTHGLLDIRSLSLFFSYCIFHYFSGYAPILAMITVKTILEYLGSLAAFSTILYNIFKTYGEVRKFVLDYKWKRRRRHNQEKKVGEFNPPPTTPDQFD